MNRKPQSPKTWHRIGGKGRAGDYRVSVQLMALSCPETAPDLGTWMVYEWELYEWDLSKDNGCVDRGSFTYGDSFIIVEDVLSQLEYLYIEKLELESVPDGECLSDADPGL